jgi:hypothetical protein
MPYYLPLSLFKDGERVGKPQLYVMGDDAGGVTFLEIALEAFDPLMPLMR